MDGAFYAIKGYSYQFDKTLIQLMSDYDENNPIYIEKIQDISGNEFVMQIKYKETQSYSDAKLREPLLQLVEAFKDNESLEYVLYCHFKDRAAGKVRLNLSAINKILKPIDGSTKKSKQINDRIAKISKKNKEDFAQKFILEFAPLFQEQYEIVLTLLEKHYGTTDKDELIFYYSQMVHAITKLVIEEDQTKRVCTKRDLLQIVGDSRKIIFTSAYKEYRGLEDYFIFVSKSFNKLKRNRHNFIFIGDIIIDSSVSVGEMVVSCVEAYYVNAKRDIKPPVFIIHPKYIDSVKKYLIERGELFNDGYETINFSSDIFCAVPLINRLSKGGKSSDSLAKISFRLRVMSEENIKNLEFGSLVPNMIYSFDSNIPIVYRDIPFNKVEGLTTKFINSLLTLK